MKLKLVKISNETPGVKSFFWEPEHKVNWTPGQYFYYTLPKLSSDDPRGATRHFTISGSPTEGNLLRLTTKFPSLMSGYKKTLLTLQVGAEITGHGPQGTFELDTKSKNTHIFIAGGIGITPFRSMIKYSYDNKLNLPLYLIYSNSDDTFVFKDELTEWLGESVVFHNSKLSGHLDKLRITKLIENWKLKIDNCAFSAVGPPPFVDGIETSLAKLKITSGKMMSEKFTGY